MHLCYTLIFIHVLLFTRITNGWRLGTCQKIGIKVKQAWTGPEVSRRLRLPDFKTIGP
jgi:hypothetical protein